ncbi:MAG: hypothetical protein WCC58_05680 [Burkholderiales bacterium]
MISPLFTFCLRRKWWLPAVLLAMPTHGYAAPMVPANENTVLESLPVRPGDPRAALLRDLRAQLSRQPKDLALALKLAQAYYSQVAEEGDPRFIGYAEAALAPWWSAPDAPVDVLVLRASIKQYRHEFAEALADLSLAQARNPAYAPAWTTSAAIHTVQARYDEARKHCDKLLALTSRLIARGCSLSVDSINGKSAEAYTSLLKELQEAESQPQNGPSAEQKLWIQTRLGEMAQRTGDAVMGEKHFRGALALGISDGYLQAAYADLLLQQKRPAEVVALLKDKTRSDLLLLRLTIAEQQLGRPEFASHRDALIARFEAARMRGDKVHQTEESRFNLQVLNNPREAIRLAQENWQVQREPRDARALLEAAAALNNFEAAHPVLQWMRTTGYEEADLRALAARLTHK